VSYICDLLSQRIYVGQLSLFCYSCPMKSIWTVEFLNDVVEQEFLSIPKDLQARLVRITDLVESYGLENLGMPYVRHLQDKLWEIRGKGKSGIARALYVAVVGRRVVILRVFVKKTQKTAPGEIALALSRVKEIDHG